ncbi:MAG: phosphoenolpyruvate carboxykinase (ATP), partial [Geminicoccales bacterium]
MQKIGRLVSRHGLEALGLRPSAPVRWNLPTPVLVQLAVSRREAALVAGGALSASTGRHTGRAPRDRFIVESPEIQGDVDWGKVNQGIDEQSAARLWAKARSHVAGRDLYVQDLYAGADPAHRLKVRVITEAAWHSLFARNMFREPPTDALADFEPDFTVLQLPSLGADPKADGTRSETAIVLDLVARRILICGSSYAGEIKKSIFTVLNFSLTDDGVLPMH